jgi:hypothetical protein
VPVNDLKSLVDYAKKNNVSYGSAGQGSLTHLAMEQFKQAAGFDAVHAAYRGIGPAITDVLGGQTQMMMPDWPRACRTSRPARCARSPSPAPSAIRCCPTCRPSRSSGSRLRRRTVVRASWDRPKLPPEITKKLNDEINKALATPELRQRLSGEALETMPMTPEQFGKFIAADIAHLERSRPGAQHQARGLDGTQHEGRGGPQRAPDHADPREVRVLASVARLERRGRPRGAPHLVNWAGCAVGAAKHEVREAALAAVRMLQPAAQSSILGRAEKVDMASAALVNGITLAHLRLRRHAPEDHHPSRGPVASALLALAEVTGASGRE